MGFWENVKKALKPAAENVEIKLDTDETKLEANVKALLDRNADGKLSIDDFFFLVKQGSDTNGNGKVDFWEIITAFFAIRKALKKFEK